MCHFRLTCFKQRSEGVPPFGFKLTKINHNICAGKTKVLINDAVTSQSLFLPLTLNAEFLTMRLVLLNEK